MLNPNHCIVAIGICCAALKQRSLLISDILFLAILLFYSDYLAYCTDLTFYHVFGYLLLLVYQLYCIRFYWCSIKTHTKGSFAWDPTLNHSLVTFVATCFGSLYRTFFIEWLTALCIHLFLYLMKTSTFFGNNNIVLMTALREIVVFIRSREG